MKYISFGDKNVILNVLKNYQQLKDSNNLDSIEVIIIIDSLIEKCRLSRRQKEVLNLIKQGYNLTEISEKIDISIVVVSEYLGKVVEKITEFNDFLYFHSKTLKKKAKNKK